MTPSRRCTDNKRFWTLQKGILAVCLTIVAVGSVIALLGNWVKCAEAGFERSVCAVEMRNFDTLHAPIIAVLRQMSETQDKTYCLIRSTMTDSQIETALRTRGIDRGIRGRSTKREW